MTPSKPAIYLDNGPAVVGTFDERREVIDVSTNLPKWDPRWEFVDALGHFHARDRDGFPTLDARTEQVDCDGSCGEDAPCEGYTRVHYSCSICREPIEPGTIAGPHHDKIPGPTSWEATVEAAIPEGQKVTVRLDDGKHVIFGVARSVERSACRGVADVEPVVTTRLVGIGELGRMERARERVDTPR